MNTVASSAPFMKNVLKEVASTPLPSCDDDAVFCRKGFHLDGRRGGEEEKGGKEHS